MTTSVTQRLNIKYVQYFLFVIAMVYKLLYRKWIDHIMYIFGLCKVEGKYAVFKCTLMLEKSFKKSSIVIIYHLIPNKSFSYVPRNIYLLYISLLTGITCFKFLWTW